MEETGYMAAVAEKLTFAEFQTKYEYIDRSYEFWHGEAVPKGMPTSIHGLLQILVAHLLLEAGYIALAEVELRIIPEAHPKPDLIATRREVEQPYPTKAVDVVVEILSEDESASYMLENVRRTANGDLSMFTSSIRKASNCFAGLARRSSLLTS